MRYVLIDESGMSRGVTTKSVATPFASLEDVIAALRVRIQELIDDPEYYLDISYIQDVDEKLESLADLCDEHVCEFLSEVWIQEEGTEGIWTNYSSADRWSVSGRLPEDEEFGNADTQYYRTAGRPEGQPVLA
jgi:hypothetical protein